MSSELLVSTVLVCSELSVMWLLFWVLFVVGPRAVQSCDFIFFKLALVDFKRFKRDFEMLPVLAPDFVVEFGLAGLGLSYPDTCHSKGNSARC